MGLGSCLEIILLQINLIQNYLKDIVMINFILFFLFLWSNPDETKRLRDFKTCSEIFFFSIQFLPNGLSGFAEFWNLIVYSCSLIFFWKKKISGEQ